MPPARLDPKHSAVLILDVQERLLPVMQHRTTLLRRVTRLVEGAAILRVPIAVTEQYPRGLGATVASLADALPRQVHREEKTRFSAVSPALLAHLKSQGTRGVVVAGLETHICVLQSCLDLLEAGYTVALCQDATGSRREVDRKAALARLTQAGVVPATVETVLFEWLGDAGAADFKALRSVIQSPDG